MDTGNGKGPAVPGARGVFRREMNDGVPALLDVLHFLERAVREVFHPCCDSP